MKDKFPIKIHRREHKQGIKFVAMTSLEKIMKTSQGIEHQLKFVELDYAITLIAAREALNAAKKNNKGDVLAFWLLGNILIEFLHRLEEMGFYLTNPNATFARDLGLGASSVKKILSFRKRFPTALSIDPTVSWSKYRNNKVPAPTKNNN
ncbi:MAG: hypothetical protein QXU09_05340 [Thermoproteota archaeon]